MAKAIGRSPVIQALQLTALFVGGAIWQQKQSHTSFMRVWLQLNSDIVAQVNSFMQPSDCDEIQLCKRYRTAGGIKQVGTHKR
jgi:hypothetical protein